MSHSSNVISEVTEISPMETLKRKRGRPKKTTTNGNGISKPKQRKAKSKTATETERATKELQSIAVELGLNIEDEDTASPPAKRRRLRQSPSLSSNISASEFESSYRNLKNPLTLYGSTRSTTNFDIRLLHFHGLNSEYARNLKLIFNNSLDTAILPLRKENTTIDEDVNDSELPKLSETTFTNVTETNILNLTREIDLRFNNNEEKNDTSNKIGVNGIRMFPKNESVLRLGFVFNTGGFPLLAKWYPRVINNKKYLFVNIVRDITSNDLSETNFDSKSESLLNIYECSFTSEHESPFQLLKSIHLDYHLKEIHFMTSKKEGILLNVLSNGSIDILKINHDEFYKKNVKKGNHIKISKPSLSLTLPSNLHSNITCATILSNTEILVGGTYGLIAKFSLVDTPSSPAIIPVFVQSTRLPTITSITSSFKGEKNGPILITSLDSHCYLIPQLKAFTPLTLTDCGSTRDFIFSQRVLYLKLNQSFAICDWPVAIKSISNRDPINCQRAKIGGNGEIWCIGEQIDSSYNGIISIGLSNGSIKLINMWNYFANEDRKLDPISVKILQLNKIESRYTLDLSYEVDSSSTALNEGIRKNTKSNDNVNSNDKEIKVTNDNDVCVLSTSLFGNTSMCVWGNGLISIENLIY